MRVSFQGLGVIGYGSKRRLCEVAVACCGVKELGLVLTRDSIRRLYSDWKVSDAFPKIVAGMLSLEVEQQLQKLENTVVK